MYFNMLALIVMEFQLNTVIVKYKSFLKAATYFSEMYSLLNLLRSALKYIIMQLKVYCNNHISKKILHFRFEYSNIQRTSLILFGMNFKKLCYLFTFLL